MDIYYQNSTDIVNDITIKLISFLKPYKKFDAMRNMCVIKAVSGEDNPFFCR